MKTETTFFSYSRTDSDFAQKLAMDLRQAGATIWLDQLDIQPGSRWDLSIERSLHSSSRLLVILTPESISSNNVMDEVSFALEENMTVLPILLKTCKIPFRLRRLQHIDFIENYDQGLKRLLALLPLEKDSSSDAAAAIPATDKAPQAKGKEPAKASRPSVKEPAEAKKPSVTENVKEQVFTAAKTPEFGKGSATSTQHELQKKANLKMLLLGAGGIALLAVIAWFIFAGKNDTGPDGNTPQQTSVADDPAEIQAWNAALADSTVSGYRSYNANYPTGLYSDEAQSRIQDIEDWEFATSLHTVQSYDAYRNKHPAGLKVAMAGTKIEALERQPNTEKQPITENKPSTEVPALRSAVITGKRWQTTNLAIATPTSLCYDNNTANCDQAGRLYTWEEAQTVCSRLGPGWRLPNSNDWLTLTQAFGGAYGDTGDGLDAYTAMVANGTAGFNAAFGGKKLYFLENDTAYFYDFGGIGYYWVDELEVGNQSNARIVTFRSSDKRVLYEAQPKKSYASCRCIKDE